MPTVPNFVSTAKLPIETAVQAPRSLARQDVSGAAAEQSLGKTITGIGIQRQKMQDTRSIIESDSIKKQAKLKMQLVIETLSPDKWEKESLKITSDSITAIRSLKMSPNARAISDVDGKEWVKEFSLGTFLATAKREQTDTKIALISSVTDNIASGADKGETKKNFMEQASAFWGAEESELLYRKAATEGEKELIFSAINAGDLELATRLTNISDLDEEDTFRMHNRIQTAGVNRTKLRNESFEANKAAELNSWAESVGSGELIDESKVPENSIDMSNFNTRTVNGSWNTSDAVTFARLNERADTGSFIDPAELDSAYFSGMSTDEYEQLKKKNDENRSFTKTQKDDLAEYNTFISTKYQDLFRTIDPKLNINSKAPVRTAIAGDKRRLINQVRSLLRAGESQEKIFKIIDVSFIGDTDKYLEGNGGVWWKNALGDFENAIVEEQDVQERYSVITDFLKATGGDDSKEVIKRLSVLLEEWYE